MEFVAFLSLTNFMGVSILGIPKYLPVNCQILIKCDSSYELGHPHPEYVIIYFLKTQIGSIVLNF